MPNVRGAFLLLFFITASVQEFPEPGEAYQKTNGKNIDNAFGLNHELLQCVNALSHLKPLNQ